MAPKSSVSYIYVFASPLTLNTTILGRQDDTMDMMGQDFHDQLSKTS